MRVFEYGGILEKRVQFSPDNNLKFCTAQKAISKFEKLKAVNIITSEIDPPLATCSATHWIHRLEATF